MTLIRRFYANYFNIWTVFAHKSAHMRNDSRADALQLLWLRTKQFCHVRRIYRNRYRFINALISKSNTPKRRIYPCKLKFSTCWRSFSISRTGRGALIYFLRCESYGRRPKNNALWKHSKNSSSTVCLCIFLAQRVCCWQFVALSAVRNKISPKYSNSWLTWHDNVMFSMAFVYLATNIVIEGENLTTSQWSPARFSNLNTRLGCLLTAFVCSFSGNML